jgi:hypothetical protein
MWNRKICSRASKKKMFWLHVKSFLPLSPQNLPLALKLHVTLKILSTLVSSCIRVYTVNYYKNEN